jgi:predicted nucleotidyltransferase
MLDKTVVRQIAESYTSRVRAEYNPKQVILFGSYVNGKVHDDSDIDIAVIFDVAPGEFLDTWAHLLKLRRGLSYDIETHLLDETMTRCGFLAHIRSTGEVLYQA